MGKARTQAPQKSVTLDAGALIALERGNRRMIALLQQIANVRGAFHVPAGVVGQVWRDGSRPAVVARFSARPQFTSTHSTLNSPCGELCAATGEADVIDASVVITAREHRTAIVSSDAKDLLKLDPSAVIEHV